jgi:hypothetical protein
LFSLENHGEDGSSQIPYHTSVENELLDILVDQLFLISLPFEQRGKLDQLGIETGTSE